MARRTTGPERVAILCRTSTDRQPVSLDAQERAARAYCDEQGYEVAAVHRDEQTGGDLHTRPGVIAALDAARRGDVQVIVALCIDRVTRGGPVALGWLAYTLEMAGARLELVDEPNEDSLAGDVMSSLKAAVGREERRKASSRNRRAYEERCRQGRVTRHGLPPFGYRRDADGLLVPHEPEAEIVREMFLRSSRGESLREICRWLNGERHAPAPRGGTWAAGQVGDTLRSSTYRGEWVGCRFRSIATERGHTTNQFARREEAEWIRVACPALVDAALWWDVQGCLDRREARHKQPRPGAPRTLRGLVTCPICHCSRQVATRKKGDRSWTYYDCRQPEPGTPRCPAPAVNADALDAWAWGEFLAIAARPEVLLAQLVGRRSGGESDGGDAIVKELARIDRQIANLVEHCVAGSIRPHEAAARRELLETQRTDAERRLRDLRSRAADRERWVTDVEGVLEQVARSSAGLRDAGPDDRRQALRDAGIRVVASGGTRQAPADWRLVRAIDLSPVSESGTTVCRDSLLILARRAA